MAARVQRLPRHRRKNLVVLVYAPNPCYVQIKALDEVEGLAVNLTRNVWQYRGAEDETIGEDNGGYQGGVIGVYDKTKIDHLKGIVRTVQSITRRNQPRGLDDD